MYYIDLLEAGGCLIEVTTNADLTVFNFEWFIPPVNIIGYRVVGDMYKVYKVWGLVSGALWRHIGGW